MLKKKITYTNFNGEEITEDFYFNLTQAEVMEWELGQSGGMTAMIQKIVNAKDMPKLTALFKTVILKSYGEKSDDGKHFAKSKEITEAFTQTQAYSQLFMELATDDVAAAAFINAIIPKEPQDHKKKDGATTPQWPAVQPVTDGTNV